MAILNFKMTGLADIIRTKMYIPKYQREYAWEKGECVDLWDDLMYLVNDGNEMHFYGQIVIHNNKDDNKLYIIDGQQRLTTSYFLIRAFLNGFSSIKYKNPDCTDAKKLERRKIEIEQLIGFDSTNSPSDQDLNLVQNEIDNDFFVKLICFDQEAIKEKQKKLSKNLMRNAIRFFDSKVKELINDANGIEERLSILKKYYESFVNRFKVMYLEDDNLNEAYTIFETLNDRGKDLTSSDLLKNYILANSTNVDLTHKKWNTIVSNLGSQDLTRFVRHLWNAQHNFTRDKLLYSNITLELQKSGLKCEKLVEDLNDCSTFYHDMFEPISPKNITNQDFLAIMKSLKTMRSSTWCPVLLAMYNKKDGNNKKVYNMEDMVNVARCIESLVFKNFVVCSNNPNEAEIDFAKLAKNITLSSLSVANIVSSIKNNIVSDSQFETSFLELTFADNEGDKEKIRYIFRKIHKYLDEANEINLNNSEVHIEHIMPQCINQWPHIDKKTYDEYLWKIGNLCLLSGTFNEEISNKPFDYKKENAYKKSIIKPNDELLQYSKWDKESIISRQKSLFEYVKKVW